MSEGQRLQVVTVPSRPHILLAVEMLKYITEEIRP